MKGFLRKQLHEKVSEEDKRKVEVLIEELKQPEKLKLPGRDKYYVIYRRSRTFASFVLTPDDVETFSDGMKHGIVVYDDCSYVATKDELRAHYYSALLNYLAYKVIEKTGTFGRHQYLRPLIAILKSNLQWRRKKWQVKVAKLGKELHQQAPKCFVLH